MRLRNSYSPQPLMSKVCAICGKKPGFGNSRSHSMVATKRRFNPNLQRVRVLLDGRATRAYVCTRCLKAGKVQKAVRPSRLAPVEREPFVIATTERGRIAVAPLRSSRSSARSARATASSRSRPGTTLAARAVGHQEGRRRRLRADGSSSSCA